MNTEFDGDDEGSSRGNCVLIASEPKREQDRTALGSQPPRQNSAYLRGLHPIGQKNRTCIGSHPWRAEARILAEKTSYVRRSEFSRRTQRSRLCRVLFRVGLGSSGKGVPARY